MHHPLETHYMETQLWDEPGCWFTLAPIENVPELFVVGGREQL